MDVWQVMRDTPRHNYQILTKRPERMSEIVSGKVGAILPNVWLGTSVENRDAIGRLDHLRRTPAAIRFISFEPLIGSIGSVDLAGIHWAIVGGESGRDARPIRKNGSMKYTFNACDMGQLSSSNSGVTWGRDNKRRSQIGERSRIPRKDLGRDAGGTDPDISPLRDRDRI